MRIQNWPTTLSLGLSVSLVLLCGPKGSSQRSSEHRKNSQATVKYLDNGALRLVIQAFVEELLRELQSDFSSTLPRRMVDALRHRFSGLHQHIRHHAALREKRLWVGNLPPQFDPEPSDFQVEADDDSRGRDKPSKTRRHAVMTEEICRTDRQWEMLNHTTDMNGKEVEVVQTRDYQQYIFSYRCVAQRGPCVGISPLYTSECEMRYGWMLLLHRDPDDLEAPDKWGYVAVPHHCACKITPRFVTDLLEDMTNA